MINDNGISIPVGLGAATASIRTSAKARLLLTPGDLNRVLRMSARSAGEMFCVIYLPQRWDLAYARRLGWRQKEGRGWVQPDQLPFFDKGDFILMAVGATPKVTATKGRVKLRIVVPVGHALRSDTARAFRTVLPDERAGIVNHFKAEAVRILETGTETISRGRGKGRLRLTAAQRTAARAIQGRGAAADLPPSFVGDMAGRRARLLAARQAYQYQRGNRWGDVQAYWAAVKSDPTRQARVRSMASARQGRRRSRLLAARIASTAA